MLRARALLREDIERIAIHPTVTETGRPFAEVLTTGKGLLGRVAFEKHEAPGSVRIAGACVGCGGPQPPAGKLVVRLPFPDSGLKRVISGAGRQSVKESPRGKTQRASASTQAN